MRGLAVVEIVVGESVAERGDAGVVGCCDGHFFLFCFYFLIYTAALLFRGVEACFWLWWEYGGMVVGGDVAVVVVDVVVDVTFHSMETRRSSADPSREEAAQTIPLPPGPPGESPHWGSAGGRPLIRRPRHTILVVIRGYAC